MKTKDEIKITLFGTNNIENKTQPTAKAPEQKKQELLNKVVEDTKDQQGDIPKVQEDWPKNL